MLCFRPYSKHNRYFACERERKGEGVGERAREREGGDPALNIKHDRGA